MKLFAVNICAIRIVFVQICTFHVQINCLGYMVSRLSSSNFNSVSLIHVVL